MNGALKLSTNWFTKTPVDTALCKREVRAHLLTHLIRNGRCSADVHRLQTGKIPPPARVLCLTWLQALSSYEVKEM